MKVEMKPMTTVFSFSQALPKPLSSKRSDRRSVLRTLTPTRRLRCCSRYQQSEPNVHRKLETIDKCSKAAFGGLAAALLVSMHSLQGMLGLSLQLRLNICDERALGEDIFDQSLRITPLLKF